MSTTVGDAHNEMEEKGSEDSVSNGRTMESSTVVSDAKR